MKSIQWLITVLALIMVATSEAQVLKLNSYPSAGATLYIDFNGRYVQSTAWNWNGDINAQPAALPAAVITEIFNRVAEDYRPFNLNITTDSTVFNAAPLLQRMRILVTPTSNWYGNNAGGVSFVGSFIWGDGTPAWVFSTLLGNNAKYIAEAISHEAGHTLGLQHQSIYDGACNKITEYSAGQGSGEIGWAPIMGVGYYKNMTTWHSGPNTINCVTIQNDLAVIAGSPNNFGFRSDDHGDTHLNATPVTAYGQNFSATGIINQPGDRDVFKLTISSATDLNLSAVPQNVGAGDAGANIDIKVTLLNATADTIGHYNPMDLLDAGIDTNLNAGVYYLIVDGVGNPNHSNYGSLGLYTLTGSLGIVLPIKKFLLSGSVQNNVHALNWSVETVDSIQSFIIESATGGAAFETIATVNSITHNFSWRPFQNGNIQYRIKALPAGNNPVYYSNIITLQKNSYAKGVQLINNHIQGILMVHSNGSYTYQLFNAAGSLLGTGKLQAGMNTIVIPVAPGGLLLLHWQDATQQGTAKFIKQ